MTFESVSMFIVIVFIIMAVFCCVEKLFNKGSTVSDKKFQTNQKIAQIQIIETNIIDQQCYKPKLLKFQRPDAKEEKSYLGKQNKHNISNQQQHLNIYILDQIHTNEAKEKKEIQKYEIILKLVKYNEQRLIITSKVIHSIKKQKKINTEKLEQNVIENYDYNVSSKILQKIDNLQKQLQKYNMCVGEYKNIKIIGEIELENQYYCEIVNSLILRRLRYQQISEQQYSKQVQKIESIRN